MALVGRNTLREPLCRGGRRSRGRRTGCSRSRVSERGSVHSGCIMNKKFPMTGVQIKEIPTQIAMARTMVIEAAPISSG